MDDRQITEIHFVEDSNDEVFIARLLLKSQKVDIRLVHYGTYSELKKAAISCDERLPIVVFIDFNLPGMKGTEIIADIRQRGLYHNLIVGICSGSEDPADRRNALEAGASFFVRKPLDRKAIERVCGLVETLTLRQASDGTLSLHAL